MSSDLKVNVNDIMFNNFSEKIIQYLDSKNDCKNIVIEIKNMKQVYPLMDSDEKENIWNNLKKLMESVPKEHFDSDFWLQLVFNEYKLK
jgi:hypothetical protein